jgi:hypothetical protein
MLVDYKVIQTAVIEPNWAILEQNPEGYKVWSTFLFLYQQGRIVIFSDSGDSSSHDVVGDANGGPHSHPHLAVIIRQRLAVPTLHHRLEVTIVTFHPVLRNRNYILRFRFRLLKSYGSGSDF